MENNCWHIVPCSEDNTEVVPSVWTMRRKCNFMTNEINKYKACLNLHGGKQSYGINYFETYAPVVTWFSTCSLINCCNSTKLEPTSS